MPYFAIHCIDRPEAEELRATNRQAHLAHLADVGESLLVAGPLLRPDGRAMGSLLIIDFDDREAAVAFAAADPYHRAGLFETRSITAWHKALPT